RQPALLARSGAGADHHAEHPRRPRPNRPAAPRGIREEPRGLPREGRRADDALDESDGADARREGGGLSSELTLFRDALWPHASRYGRGPAGHPALAPASRQPHPSDE